MLKKKTKKIYYAQLNVSKFYTVEEITRLINRLGYLGQDIYYNNETRSIDIEEPIENINYDMIREEVKQWIKELPADEESIKIICDNINLIFNITKIKLQNDTIIKLYLY